MRGSESEAARRRDDRASGLYHRPSSAERDQPRTSVGPDRSEKAVKPNAAPRRWRASRTQVGKPMVGVEPATSALRKPCSAIELHRRDAKHMGLATKQLRMLSVANQAGQVWIDPLGCAESPTVKNPIWPTEAPQDRFLDSPCWHGTCECDRSIIRSTLE